MIIVGFGGQGRTALSIARHSGIEVLKFVNALEGTECPQEIDGIPATQEASFIQWMAGRAPDVKLVIAIGDNQRKKELAAKYSEMGCRFAKLISNLAFVDPTATIGMGSIIAPFSFVGPRARVGSHVKIDSGCVVSHDCRIRAYAALSPGVSLGGGIIVGEGILIGVGAAIHPHIRIGAWSTVGLGAVVTKDVPHGVTVFGNPARVMWTKEACCAGEKSCGSECSVSQSLSGCVRNGV